MAEEWPCPREDEKHESHAYSEENENMETVWYECPGVGYW